MKLNIEELANKVNMHLSNLSSTDKRFSNNLSARRIRDYISKGVLDKPFKDGKNIYFTELHYQKLIVLREVQSEGISEENVKKMISYESQNNEENSLKSEAFSVINEIINFKDSDSLNNVSILNNANIGKLSHDSVGLSTYQSSSMTNSQTRSANYLNSLIDNSPLSKAKETKSYTNITKAISRSWSEMPLLNNNKVYFRMESNTTFSEKEKKEVLQNVRQILGIQGEKND